MAKPNFTINDLKQKCIDGANYVKNSFVDLLNKLNLRNIFEFLKVHTVGLVVGLKFFFSSKPVLIGMGIGLLGATIVSIFSAPIAPIALYISFAKVALVSGVTFGFGSTFYRGLSNFFLALIQDKGARKGLAFPVADKEHGPVPMAIFKGYSAANSAAGSKSPIHMLYVPGDKVNLSNFVSCAEQVIDGDHKVITSFFK